MPALSVAEAWKRESVATVSAPQCNQVSKDKDDALVLALKKRQGKSAERKNASVSAVSEALKTASAANDNRLRGYETGTKSVRKKVRGDQREKAFELTCTKSSHVSSWKGKVVHSHCVIAPRTDTRALLKRWKSGQLSPCARDMSGRMTEVDVLSTGRSRLGRTSAPKV